MDKTKSEAWMSIADNLAKHGQSDSRETHALNIAVALASAYRRGMADALQLKRGEDKAHLITVHQPDGQIVTVKNTEAKEE